MHSSLLATRRLPRVTEHSLRATEHVPHATVHLPSVKACVAFERNTKN